jgi:signal transduction histidine kinase
LLLAFPDGRPRTTGDRVAVVVGYAAALAAPVWDDELASIAAAVIVVVLLFRRYATAAGRVRLARGYALGAGAALAAVVAGSALVRLALPAGDSDELVLAVYELVLVVVAWWLALAVVRQPWEAVPVTDLVVDLAEGAGAPARLARALGDPTLRVLDSDGPAGGARTRTLVYREGTPVVALVHDPSLAADPSLQEAVSAVATLTAAHGRLEAEVRAGVEEVSASRRRLLHAAEDERRRLELELRERAGDPLIGLRDRLAGFSGDPEVTRIVAQARRRLELALGDLDAVARGLHPRALSEGGLARGLEDLAATSANAVRVNVELPRLREDVEATAYYVCAEAVANAAKHAHARHVVIDSEVYDGALRLSVCDDGVGGARLVRGGGLQGLRDRVEAVGGALSVESPAAGGTRVEVRLEL